MSLCLPHLSSTSQIYIYNTASLHNCRAPSVLKDRQIRNGCRCKKILKQQFIKVEHGYVCSVSTLSNLDLKRKCARGLAIEAVEIRHCARQDNFRSNLPSSTISQVKMRAIVLRILQYHKCANNNSTYQDKVHDWFSRA